MNEYKILKILSNNAVLVDHRDTTYILVGKGIGFGRKKNENLDDPTLIESRFISLEGLKGSDYEKFMDNIDPVIIEVTQKILDMTEQELNVELNPNIHAGLLDHIQFAAKRLMQGIPIVDPFLCETKLLYPKEFKIAENAVNLLRQSFSMEIPDDEIGFLTYHIYAGINESSKKEALENSKIISRIAEHTLDKLSLEVDKTSFDYNRFIIHLRGVLTRVKTKKTLKNNLLTEIKQKNIIEFKVAYDIAKMIGNSLGENVPDDEIGYIAIHLMKLNS